MTYPERTDVTSPRPRGSARWRPPQWRRWSSGWNTRLLIGLVIVVLGVLTAVQGIVTGNQVRQLQTCQARYSNAFADALDARTKASNDSQAAMDRLVTAIGVNLRKGGNPADMQRAVADYNATRAAASQQRKAHPLPPPPRQACR